MLLLTSLGVLMAGMICAMILIRAPRAGLLVAMGAIVTASVLGLVTAGQVLLGGGDVAARTLSWALPMGTATLAIDGLSAWFLLVISVLSIAVAIYSWGYMQEEIGHGPVPAFSGLMCVLVASMMLLVCAGDVMLFLVAWEIMTVAAFLLVNFHDQQEEVRYGGWIYLIAAHVGTALFLLPMFSILVWRGGMQFAGFAGMLRSADPELCVALFVLGLVGFGTKAGFMPMHVWLPNAHPVAPTPVSAFLSGVMVKMGIYGLVRLLSWLPPLPMGCAMVMLAFGVVSGILGVLYAMAQHDLKRLLAYHTVENIGIIGVGIGVGMLGQTTGYPLVAALGYAGALLHVLNHAMFKGLLFMSAGAVIHSAGTGQIDRLGGLAKRMPINAALFLVAAVSICGLPPFNGFVSEWMIYGGLFGGAIRWTAAGATAAVVGLVALAVMGGLALACFAKAFSVVFLGEPRETQGWVPPVPRMMASGMVIPAILCVGIGVLPVLVVPLLATAAETVVAMPMRQFGESLERGMQLAAVLTAFAAVFGVMVGALVLIRRKAGAPAMMASAPSLMEGPKGTWGCGFAFPTARIQYTASSFAWSLVTNFRRLLWPEVHYTRPVGYFPAAGELATHTPDVAEHDVFAPIFRGVARLVQMLKTLSWDGEVAEPIERHGRVGPFRAVFEGFLAAMRRGNIQVRLMYIVLTLLVVFAAEFTIAQRSGNHKTDDRTQKVEDRRMSSEVIPSAVAGEKGHAVVERSRP
ncbi:MAG: proton-conducting transporter membrane subunit [Bacillota bacterium]